MRHNPIKVLCVDDNDLVAEAIKTNLRSAGGFRWVGHLEKADELPQRVARDHPDVVLLDIDMPGRDPFEAVAELTRTSPETHVLMLSALVRSDLIDRALDAGAWGYLSKNDSSTLVSAIRRVDDDEFVMGPEAAAVYALK
jgi:two-component system response regulator DesR